tara:strand:+ start:53279 stop:53731 length:453 start_codon:yes stop_codon:yes gene_type:complete
MKFVYGSPIEKGPKGWYLQLSKSGYSKTDESIFAFRYLVEQVNNKIERECGHWDEDFTPMLLKPLNNPIALMKDRAGCYMNKSGGTTRTLYNITDEREVKFRRGMKWPNFDQKKRKVSKQQLNKTVKISKWPNGSHYYATLEDGTLCDGL